MPPTPTIPQIRTQDAIDAKSLGEANPNPQQNLTAPGLPHGMPSVDPLVATMYVLYYREGQNPHPQTKYFNLKGEFRQVIARVKRHCELMHMRFINVRPFLSNLDDDERRIGRFEPNESYEGTS